MDVMRSFGGLRSVTPAVGKDAVQARFEISGGMAGFRSAATSLEITPCDRIDRDGRAITSGYMVMRRISLHDRRLAGAQPAFESMRILAGPVTREEAEGVLARESDRTGGRNALAHGPDNDPRTLLARNAVAIDVTDMLFDRTRNQDFRRIGMTLRAAHADDPRRLDRAGLSKRLDAAARACGAAARLLGEPWAETFREFFADQANRCLQPVARTGADLAR